MSTTPSQAGTGGAGGTFPKRPVAYPKAGGATAPAAAPAAPPAPAPTHARPAAPAAPAAAGAVGAAAAPSHAPASKSVSGPPAPQAKPHPFSRRNLVLGGSAAAALVLIVALLVWRPWSPEPPRLNDQPYRIAQFATSNAMSKLPFSQQREYMDILDDKDDALIAAYKEGRLTDQQYRRALQLGWYAKHLDRMDKYFGRPPALRTWYIDEKVLGKKLKKKKENDKPDKPGGKADPKKEEEAEEESDDASPLNAEEIDRDDSTEEQDIKKWPGDVQAKWNEYRTALAARKQFFKDLERQEKEKRKAAEAKAAGATAGTGTGAATGATAAPDAGGQKAPASQ